MLYALVGSSWKMWICDLCWQPNMATSCCCDNRPCSRNACHCACLGRWPLRMCMVCAHTTICISDRVFGCEHLQRLQKLTNDSCCCLRNICRTRDLNGNSCSVCRADLLHLTIRRTLSRGLKVQRCRAPAEDLCREYRFVWSHVRDQVRVC